MDGLEPHWWWLIIAVILGALELLMPGVFLIWLAAAAAATGFVAMAFGPPLAFQLVIFTGLALAATYVGRRWYIAHPVESADPMLNDRGARMIGETVTVVEPIVAGRGRVRVGDGVWPARGADAAEGDCLRVTGVEGGALIVEPVARPALPNA